MKIGLDQYANWTNGSTNEDGDIEKHQFKYWRKTSHIQDFFQKIYAEKTGDNDPNNFNCVEVEIDFDLLNRFITAVKSNSMTPVNGFFFGGGYDASHPDVVEEDLKFASDCFFHLLMGRKVTYSSWW